MSGEPHRRRDSVHDDEAALAARALRGAVAAGRRAGGLIAFGAVVPERYGLLPTWASGPLWLLVLALVVLSTFAHASPLLRRIEGRVTRWLLALVTGLARLLRRSPRDPRAERGLGAPRRFRCSRRPPPSGSRTSSSSRSGTGCSTAADPRSACAGRRTPRGPPVPASDTTRPTPPGRRSSRTTSSSRSTRRSPSARPTRLR